VQQSFQNLSQFTQVQQAFQNVSQLTQVQQAFQNVSQLPQVQQAFQDLSQFTQVQQALQNLSQFTPVQQAFQNLSQTLLRQNYRLYRDQEIPVNYMYGSTLLKPNLPLGCSGIEMHQARGSHNFWINYVLLSVRGNCYANSIVTVPDFMNSCGGE